MIVSVNFPIRCLALYGVSMIASTGALSSLMAQDFEIIERRLGGIVADGELTLQQASVMLNSLHEFAENQELREREEREHGREHQLEVREQLRRLGVDDAIQNQARKTLEAEGIHGERLGRTMQVLSRLFSAMRSTDQRVGISPDTRHHLKSELDLTDEQIATVMNLATRFQQAERHRPGPRDQDRDLDRLSDRHNATTEAIVDWVEMMLMDLKHAVESGHLSKDEAWQKWQKVKETKIESKLKANLESGELSEDRVNQIKELIEKNDSRFKSKIEDHQD
ncbi:hypothetical protein SH528x_005019 [Novipirellula sp. SH528]|uniref:hypothetical protein n=1 Tax=Novipirellula sp. SH528 TaxID=3454466 RepID=UPI003F9FD2B0